MACLVFWFNIMTNNSERMIVLSPALILKMNGMEKAALYQAIMDGGVPIGPVWSEVSNELIMKWLPMWSQEEIKSLLVSLVADKHLYLNSPPFGQTNSIIYSTDPLALESSCMSKTQRAYNNAKELRFGKLRGDWKPSQSTMQFLSNRFQITTEMIDRFLPDFINENLSKPANSSWDTIFVKWAKINITTSEPTLSVFERDADSKSLMTWEWQPADKAMKILDKIGIDKDFAREAIPLFNLYWIERGEAHNTWNTRFINWVKRDYARHTETLINTGNNSQMTNEWMPSVNVLEILKSDNISQDFVQSIIPEFKLYWLESGRAFPSWDAKFLRQIRFQWHGRLKQLGSLSQREYLASTNIADRLNDMSWANGM